MTGHECYHCKQWIEEGEEHDCWTTTEAALTQDLTEELHDAWERLREAAASLGDQRIYASHKSIMFSRKSCYAFVRPKKQFLELSVFMPREVKAAQVRRATRSSRTKILHIVHIRHRDQVEAPLTDWLQEAYELSGGAAAGPASAAKRVRRAAPVKAKNARVKKATPREVAATRKTGKR
jgi:hypothetical protein